MNRRHFLGGAAVAAASLIFPELNTGGATHNSDVRPSQVSAHCPSGAEWAFLTKINQYRASYGIHPLKMSRSLAAAARHHAYYMSVTDDVDHSLGSVSWAQNILNYGYPKGYGMGENVLGGRSSSGGALNLWISSPTHNANMLNPAWIRIGVGRIYNLNGKYDYYWCTTFGTVSHRTISSC